MISSGVSQKVSRTAGFSILRRKYGFLSYWLFASGAKGQRFESSRAYQILKGLSVHRKVLDTQNKV
jgi:hypothetical protein